MQRTAKGMKGVTKLSLIGTDYPRTSIRGISEISLKESFVRRLQQCERRKLGPADTDFGLVGE
jgi:hypothetical protein